jgi:hypothetical protein
MLSTRSPTAPRPLCSVGTAPDVRDSVFTPLSAVPHAVTSVHWQTGQLLACLKEHPLLRPIFHAFLSVVCLLLKPLSLPTAPEPHAAVCTHCRLYESAAGRQLRPKQ